MKKFLFPILALVLAVGLTLPLAGTLGANPGLPEYQTALEKSANYLVSIQDEDGFWAKKPGGSWGADAENPTGNAITALLEAYQMTGDPTYPVAAKKGGDYLIDVFIAGDGSFDVHQAEIIGGNAYMNHLSPMLTAWIRLYQVTGQEGYKDAAVAMGEYLLTCGARCLDEANPYYGLFGYLIRPTCIACTYHGHFLNYGYEEVYGLASLYEITGDGNYLEAAELEAGLEIDFQNADGSFPSLYSGIDDMSLLDIHYGSAMMLAHGKLYDITGDSQYKNALVDYVGWLLTQRNADGSFGDGDYVRSTTWAIKALLEAWRLTCNSIYMEGAQTAGAWLLESGHGYDATTGAVARYDKSEDVYVAYSQTPFIMTMAELPVRPTPTTLYYGDFTLPSGGSLFLQPQMWDLNACDVTVSYTLDLTGAPNQAYYWSLGIPVFASADVGLIWPGPGWAGARMCGFLSDWDNADTLFPTFPDIDNNLDLDDKFNMQRFPNPGSWDELMYDVYCETNSVAASPFGSYSNYGIWFDRDGVDPYQPAMWGMVDGGTYNNGGVYEVRMTYRKASSAKGTACPVLFPDLVNDDAPGGYGIPTGFNRIPKTDPNYPGYYDFPAGISFDTDETKMASMQVVVSGDSADGTIIVKDLAVTGCLVLEEGMATGGGWFIPEASSAHGLVNPGGKATFGFVAKQKNETSSGQLEFQYHADELNLKSTSYEWVTLSNTQVIFQGEGRLNDDEGYKFRVWAFDGDKAGGQPDRFTIRIWTGSDSYGSPTYRAEGDLGGGQIVVHKK